MFDFIYRAKIRTVVSIGIVFLSLIIFVQGVLAIYNVYDSRRQAVQMASLIISKDVENLSELFSRINSLTDILETDEDFIYRPMSSSTGELIADSKKFNEMYNRFESMVSNSVKTAPFYNAFLFLNDELPLSYIAPDFGNRINLSAYTSTTAIYTVGSVSHYEWVEKLKSSSDYIVWFDKIKNRDTLFFAKKITMRSIEHNEVTMLPIGIFYVSYDLSSLLGQLELTEMYPSSAITLIFNDDIIYETGAGNAADKSRGISYTSSIYPGLTLMTNISRQDINTPFTRQMVVGIIMLVLAFSFGILVLSYINKAVVSPITNMAKHLLADERSKLSYSKKLNPEVAILYKNHNYMVDHTKKVMEESRKSYYKMLQSQINPHFTYNVLNSISAISLMKGDFEIAQTLSNLVEMLRYGINSPDELVDIEKELDIIRKFVSIQNFRYDNNVYIEYNIPCSLMHTKMPKLTLQPLVENSIFHSDRSLAEGDIKIEISARKDGDKIIVTIHDHNCADPDTLNNHLSSTEDEVVENRRGLGIRNINQRLALVFGEKYGIKYTSDVNGLCTVVMLPANTTEA